MSSQNFATVPKPQQEDFAQFQYDMHARYSYFYTDVAVTTYQNDICVYIGTHTHTYIYIYTCIYVYMHGTAAADSQLRHIKRTNCIYTVLPPTDGQ
jgi:hypothetical protein